MKVSQMVTGYQLGVLLAAGMSLATVNFAKANEEVAPAAPSADVSKVGESKIKEAKETIQADKAKLKADRQALRSARKAKREERRRLHTEKKDAKVTQ